MAGDLWIRAVEAEALAGRPAADPIYIEAFQNEPPPDVPLALLRHGQLLGAAGLREQSEAALASLASAGVLDAEHVAEAWLEIATLRLGRSDIPATVSALERVVEDGAGDGVPRALRNMGTFLEDHFGDDAGAEQAYRAALAHADSPHAVGAAVNLGQLLVRTDRWDEADALWQAAVGSGHPVEAARAGALRGIALSERGKHQDALDAFTATAQRAPSEWTARAAFNAGMALLNGQPRSSPQEAASWFDVAASQFAAEELPNEYAMATVCLADAYLQVGTTGPVPELLDEAERYGPDVVLEQVSVLRRRVAAAR